MIDGSDEDFVVVGQQLLVHRLGGFASVVAGCRRSVL